MRPLSLDLRERILCCYDEKEGTRKTFLDESAAKTNLTPLRGRAPQGECVHASSPHGHRHTTTMICSIRAWTVSPSA
jgi:hypothetical protein